MTLGDVLLVAGALAAIAGIAVTLSRRIERAPLTITIIAAGALTSALALLAWKFLQPDLSTFYVWSQASPDNPWYYRLAGLWTSQPGTLLLWSWYTSLGALALAVRYHKTRDSTTRLALVFALGIAASLALYAESLRLFSPTSDWRITTLTNDGTRITDWIFAPDISTPNPLEIRPNGNSLNPLLLSPFMVIHPWLEFAAYAFAGLAWSVAVAMLLTRGEGKREQLWPWARLSWTFYTLAITLGALWAYYTLSFGGYWAWDPVETANIIPWITLTALLHTRPSPKASLVTPALAAGAFALTLFATFATRTGLWASSVHAFINMASGNMGDAASRLVAILQGAEGMADLARLLALAWGIPTIALLYRAAQDPRGSRVSKRILEAHAILTGALLAYALWDPVACLAFLADRARIGGDVLTGALLLVAVWTSVPIVAWLLAGTDESRAAREKLQLPREPTLVRAAVALLSLWALVTLVLLVRGVNGSQRVVFDARVPLIAAPVALVALTAFAQRALGRRRAPWAILTSALAGLAIAIVAPATDFAGRIASFDSGLLVGLAALAAWTTARGTTTIERISRLTLITLALGIMTLAASPPPFVAGVTLPSALTPVGIVASLVLFAFAFIPRTRERRGRAWARDAHAATVPLIHLGVALLFIGFGLSTFLSTEAKFKQDKPILLGDTVDVGGGYALTFTKSDGVLNPEMSTTNETVYRSVTTHLLVSRWGKPIGEAPLRMYFVQAKDHYDPSSLVLRQPDGDLYINANFANAHAMYSDADGWVVGHGPTTHMTSANITKIAMTIRVLPYVNVLWTGLWLLVACGFARLILPILHGKTPAPLIVKHSEEDATTGPA